MEITSFQGIKIQIDRKFRSIGDLGWGTYNYGSVKRPRWYAAKTYHCHYLLLHRLIFETSIKRPLLSTEFIDHINRDTLDNRLKNLRIASIHDNFKNSVVSKKMYSNYKGVTWEKDRKQWKAAIKVNGKSINLGRFYDEKDAAKMYDIAAKRFFGKYAYLNFPSKTF